MSKNTDTIDFTDIQNEVLIGLMLGDGCLFKRTPGSNAHLTVNRAIFDIEYLDYNYKIFQNLCKSGVKLHKWNDTYFGGVKISCQFGSRSLPCFTKKHDLWYKNRVKIIPESFTQDWLTDLVLAIWFLDDGTCAVQTQNPDKLAIRLYTNCFSKDEVELLRKYLSLKLNEYFTLGTDKRTPNQWIIIGSDSAARAYFKKIDKIIPKCMDRKCIWRNDNFKFFENNLNNYSKSQNKFGIEIEYKIFNCLMINDISTIKDISDYCEWKWDNNIIPTKSIFRYLNKLIELNYIEMIGRRNASKTEVKLTIDGLNYFNENLKNKSINDILFCYKPLTKVKKGPK